MSHTVPFHGLPRELWLDIRIRGPLKVESTELERAWDFGEKSSDMRLKAKNHRRPELRKITAESLEATASQFLVDYPNPADYNQMMANSLISHYLGGEWLDTYVNSRSCKATYLRVDINAPFQEKAKAFLRVWEFAEALINFQNVEGFEAVLDELSFGKIESGCAEIDVARMIAFHELKFRFVQPTKKKKSDYDYEIFYPDGFKVCADTKSKFESTKPRAKSIIDSLKAARDQLPDDEPSVVLVKVPEKWISDTVLAQDIISVAHDYLRQSNHIMSVKFYAPLTIFTYAAVLRRHVYNEVSNPKFQGRDWDMFRDETVPVNAAPSWWIRTFQCAN